MGRIFIEEIHGKYTCSCKQCDTPLTDLSKMKTLNVETVKGRGTVFTTCSNIIVSNVNTIGQFHKSSELYLFDFDCPLECMYTGECRNIYCKVCLFHIGWKNSNNYVLLKSRF